MDASSAMVLSTLYSMYDEGTGEEDSFVEDEITSNLDEGTFFSLPEAVLELILFHLSAADLASVGSTCSTLAQGAGRHVIYSSHFSANSPLLWYSLLKESFGAKIWNPSTDWKQEMKTTHCNYRKSVRH